MFVAVLQVDLQINRARSLKDKRQVVKSILDRLRSSFNVSASEIEDLDLHQRAGLAFSAVSNDSDYVRGQMQQILNHLKAHPAARVLDHQLEVF